MHNKKTLKRTLLNYSKAIERLNDRGFKTFALDGSGYAFYIGESWRSEEGDYKQADKCSVNAASLFEYGRPQLVDTTWWLYKSSFIRIRLAAVETYELVALNYGKPINNEHNIVVLFADLSYGLNEWESHKQKITAIASVCKEHIKDYILRELLNADSEVLRWRDAKRKLLSTSL